MAGEDVDGPEKGGTESFNSEPPQASMTMKFSEELRLSGTADLLNLDLLSPKYLTLADAASQSLTIQDKRTLSRQLQAETYYREKKGGHWFVSGALVFDGRLAGHGNTACKRIRCEDLPGFI